MNSRLRHPLVRFLIIWLIATILIGGVIRLNLQIGNTLPRQDLLWGIGLMAVLWLSGGASIPARYLARSRSRRWAAYAMFLLGIFTVLLFVTRGDYSGFNRDIQNVAGWRRFIFFLPAALNGIFITPLRNTAFEINTTSTLLVPLAGLSLACLFFLASAQAFFATLWPVGSISSNSGSETRRFHIRRFVSAWLLAAILTSSVALYALNISYTGSSGTLPSMDAPLGIGLVSLLWLLGLAREPMRLVSKHWWLRLIAAVVGIAAVIVVANIVSIGSYADSPVRLVQAWLGQLIEPSSLQTVVNNVPPWLVPFAPPGTYLPVDAALSFLGLGLILGALGIVFTVGLCQCRWYKSTK